MYVKLSFGPVFEEQVVSGFLEAEFLFELCILADELVVFLLERLALILEAVATQEYWSAVVD